MLFLFLACSVTLPAPKGASVASDTASDTGGPVDPPSESDVISYDILCIGTETYDVTIIIGVPPTYDVTIWAHRPEWYTLSNGGDAWEEQLPTMGESGDVLIPCVYADYSGVGGPAGGFVPDRYLVDLVPVNR